MSSFGELVIGYWLLVTGYWLLVIGYWLLVTGYKRFWFLIPVLRFRMVIFNDYIFEKTEEKVMPTITRFEDLEAWKIARDLTAEVYKIARNDSFYRDHGLRNQICRASVSIMSNIAEGFDRDGTKEFVNFLSIAKGSCAEVRAQLYVALDQSYLSRGDFDRIYEKAARNARVISGLMRYLNNSGMRGHRFVKEE